MFLYVDAGLVRGIIRRYFMDPADKPRDVGFEMLASNLWKVLFAIGCSVALCDYISSTF